MVAPLVLLLAAGGAYATGCANSAGDCKLTGECAETGAGGDGQGGMAQTTSSAGGAGQGGGARQGGGACGQGGSSAQGGGPAALNVCSHWRYGAGGDQAAAHIALDAAGNVVVSGAFTGQLNFNGMSLSTSTTDLFVAKLDPTGMALWAKSFPVTHMASAMDPSSGEVILAGTYSGNTIDFGCGVLDAMKNFFVVKLGQDGLCVLSKDFSADVVTAHLAVDALGNIAIAGASQGTVHFKDPVQNAGGRDIYVAKLDSAGNSLWNVAYRSDKTEEAAGVAFDASNDMIVAGAFNGTLDLGDGGQGLTAKDFDVVLLKLSQNGALLLNKRFGEEKDQRATALAIDAQGRIIVTGFLADGGIDFGGGTLTATEGLFVAALDNNGDYVWSRAFDGCGPKAIIDMATGPNNELALVGSLQGELDVGGKLSSAGASEDILAVVLDQDGNPLWSRIFGDSDGDQQARSVTFSGSELFLAGSFNGNVDFGDGMTLTSTSQSDDIFIARFCP